MEADSGGQVMVLIVMFALWGFWEIGLMPLWAAIVSTVIAVCDLVDTAYERGIINGSRKR